MKFYRNFHFDFRVKSFTCIRQIMIKLWVKFYHEYLILFDTNVYHTFLEGQAQKETTE